MSDLVTIASSAVSLYQRALGTVSNNIANVDTDGYTRQELDQKENNTRQYGTSYFGTGAYLAGIKRQYDIFVEKNLRDSSSELESQSTVVDYANRIVDVLANENVSLIGALDRFFKSANDLATDPASTIYRNAFITESEGISSQFKTLSGQLALLENETSESVKSNVGEVNSLINQLAEVNRQLSKKSSLDKQPPEILDQRDLLLRDLAKIVKVNMLESASGQVKVYLGNQSNRGVLLDSVQTRALSAIEDQNQPGGFGFVIEANTPRAESTTTPYGGELSGLIGLRDKLLLTTRDQIDFLAQNFVSSVNTIHQNGLDSFGNKGVDLFRIDPKFTIESPVQESSIQVDIQIQDLLKFNANDIEISFDANAGQSYNLKITDGNFSDGDLITFGVNGLTADYNIEAGLGGNTDGIRNSIKRFLNDAFGTSLNVQLGPSNDLNITSSTLSTFNFSSSTDSQNGVLEQFESVGVWTAKDLVTSENVSGKGPLLLNGLELNFVGNPSETELLILQSQDRSSEGIQVLINDPAKIAAASQFRLIDSEFNTSETLASIKYEIPSLNTEFVDTLENVIESNDNVDSSISIDGTTKQAILQIPQGNSPATFFLDNTDLNSPSELQLFTSDGRHLLGRHFADSLIQDAEAQARSEGRILSESEKDTLIQQAGNSYIQDAADYGVIQDGATYSTQYLNGGNDGTYKEYDIFYGHKVSSLQSPVYDTDNHLIIDYETKAATLQLGDLTPNSDGMFFGHDSIAINGSPVRGLTHFKYVDGSITPTFTIDTKPTFFNDGNFEVSVREEYGELVYQLTFPGGIINGKSEIKNGREILSFPDVEGKYTDLEISHSGAMVNGDTISFDVEIVDGQEQITESTLPAFTSSAQSINSGNPMVIEITVGYESYSINLAAGGDTPAAIVSALNSASLGITAEYTASNTILLTGQKREENRFTIALNDSDGNSVGISFNNNQEASSENLINHVVDWFNEQNDIYGNNLTTAEGITINLVDGDPTTSFFDTRIELVRDVDNGEKIELSFLDDGTTDDLGRLGLRTGVYIEGSIDEPLLLFSSGSSTASLTATYESNDYNHTETLRNNPFEVQFLSEKEYTIKDVNTGSIIAKREFNVNETINYAGISLKLTSSPQTGDSFVIDGNQDGIGSNQNIAAVADLQKTRIIGGENGLTLSEYYDNTVTKVGDSARQASVSKEALSIVYNQAVEQRDKISGVSLDQEAADLVRFQQAYQASARIMSTANQLFDAILQIR